MTRDELEAVIRRELTVLVALVMSNGCDTGILNRATERFLKAADTYGLAEFGIAATRRRLALAEAVGDASYGGIAGGS